jgi:hypothetical protein
LLEAIGAELRFDLLGFRGLLASDAQVDLLQLGIELGVFSAGDQLNMGQLLNTSVTAAELLDAAINVAGPGAPVVTIPNNGPADTVSFLLSEIMSADTSGDSDAAGASLRLGNVAFASSFAAARGVGGNGIQVNASPVLNVDVLSPPQVFVAVKRNTDGAVIASARTEQLSLSTRVNGLLDLDLIVGGGLVEVRDIDCRLPQSASSVLVDMESTPIAADLGLPSLPLLGGAKVLSADVGSGSANGIAMVGFPNPTLDASYSFEAGQGVGNLLTGLNSEIGLLSGILTVLATNPVVNAALGQLGGVLDTALTTLGLETNEVYVQVDNMDCFNTAVLTR